jgi:hypothetical protein
MGHSCLPVGRDDAEAAGFHGFLGKLVFYHSGEGFRTEDTEVLDPLGEMNETWILWTPAPNHV